LGGFIFIIAATRSLGLDAFAPVSQLWTIWALSAAVTTFSYQQLTIRRAWQQGTRIPPTVLVAPVALAIIVFVASALASNRLFGSSSLGWPAAAAGTPIGAAVIGITRGRWAARGRYVGLALVVASENAIRAALALLLAVLGASVGWYGLAILVGFSAAVFSPRTSIPSRHGTIDESAGSMVGAAGLAGLLAHSTLVLPPLIAAGLGASRDEVSILFAYLASLRVPYQIALGVVPRAAERWTQASVDSDTTMFTKIRFSLLTVAIVGGSVAALLSAAIGDQLAGLLFDGSGVLSTSARAMAGAAAVVAVSNLGLTVAGISDGRAFAVASRWLAGVLAAAAAFLLFGETGITAVLAAVLAVEMVVLLLLSAMHPTRRGVTAAVG